MFLYSRIRKNLESDTLTSYDYGIYRAKILRMNLIIAIVVLIIEAAISVLLYFENAIIQSLSEYFLRFLILPTVINFSLVGFQNYIVKSDKYDEKVKNHVSAEVLAIVCVVVSYTHYVFGCTLLVYCIPIFTSVLFSDKWITRMVKVICLLGVILTGIERYVTAKTEADSKLFPEIGIAIAVVLLSTYIAKVLIRLITDQNNALLKSKKEAEDSRDEADRANTAKGRFLANMSHEIRTPINAILGFDTMILRQSTEKQILTFAKDIQSAGKNLLAVINDILDFSKIESGKMELVCVEYDFASLINDVINMIRPKVYEKGLELNVNIDEHIPSRLYGDDLRIKQILVNLINNAVKYTPSGSVTLEVTSKRSDNGVDVLFSVKDTGIGIKPEDISKLSEEFVRIEEAKNKQIEGTGLGINITINFLKMMGSRLNVESVYGEGSNFYFEVFQPVINDSELGDFNERIKNFDSEEDYQVAFCIPDCRLLVVDDNSMNRLVFRHLLSDMECIIEEAETGKQCLEMVKEQKYDIIFMDHMMPDMDGIETFHRMKAFGEYINSDTPVIILTANAISGARESYLEEGFHDYISKPIDADKLEKMIGNLVPDEKKKAAKKHEKGKCDVSADCRKMVEDMPYIDGVDWLNAIQKLGERKALDDVISNFSLLALSDIITLKNMYANLCDSESEEAYEEFRIKVHAMKTSVAIMGAHHVAGLAKYLEYAARDKNIDTIKSLMPLFEKEWLGLKGAVEENFASENTENKEALSASKLQRCLDILKEAIGAMDVDRADAVVQELSEFAHPREQMDILKELKVTVLNIDIDATKELADKWKNMIE